MSDLCSEANPCLYFFPGMGYRPAVHAVQRDQYGDRIILVVGDDSPIEGKQIHLPQIAGQPVDPYAFLPPAAFPIGAMATPSMTTGGVPVPAIFFPGGGGSGGSGSGGGGSGGGGGDGFPGDGTNTGVPIAGGSSSTPPMTGGVPDLPPLAPVPLPGGAVLMLTVMASLLVMRLFRALATPA